MMVLGCTNMGVHQLFPSIPSCAAVHTGETLQKWKDNIKGMCEHCQFPNAGLMEGKKLRNKVLCLKCQHAKLLFRVL